MPGLLPASTEPAPARLPTRPEPPSTALEATVTAPVLTSAPLTTSLPASTAVVPV